MRGDVMGWVGRLVAVVFGLGVLALLGAVFVLIRQAEGVPPLPVFLGLLGLAVLILLAGACLALISIAVSARRGVAALQRTGVAPGMALPETADATDAPASMQGPVQGPMRPVAVPARPATRPGRVVVAER